MQITMDSRQRVLRTLSFQPVDRVPFDLMEGAVWPELLDYFRQEHAIDNPAEVIEFLDPDFRWTFLAYLGPKSTEQNNSPAPVERQGYTKPVVAGPLAQAETSPMWRLTTCPTPTGGDGGLSPGASNTRKSPGLALMDPALLDSLRSLGMQAAMVRWSLSQDF
jgi:hypothetical protein